MGRVEELAGKIAEARRLRERSIEECNSLMNAEESKIWTDAALTDVPTLDDVTTYLARGRQSKQGESNHYLIKTQHVQMGQYVKTAMTLAPEVADKVTSDALVKKGDWQREKIGFRLTELNVSDMRRVPIPLPPLPEQRRIVEYLDELQAKVDEMKRYRQRSLAELDALLPAILDKAFKGEL